MIKFIILLFCILSGVSSATPITPLDLEDEARNQLEELRSIVQGEIFVARDDLQNFYSEFGQYSINVAGEGMIAMYQEEDTVNEQIASIKSLAEASGKDITSCIDEQEQVLNGLTFQYGEEMGYCLGGNSYAAMLVMEDSKYYVDIMINKVQTLDFQLLQCRGDILCISPLVTEIELDKIRLPQNIKTEVQKCDSLLTIMKLDTQQCADDKVASYISHAGAILGDITDCVEQIIG